MSRLELAAPEAVAIAAAERRERIATLAGGMATQFNVPIKDFSVIETVADTKPVYTVAYTALAGVNAGSWNSIFSEENAENFMIEVDGETYDTRSGMNQVQYKTFIETCIRSRMRPLPDSKDLYELVGYSEPSAGCQPYTWLTGEFDADRNDEKASLGCVREPGFLDPFGSPYPYVTDRHKGRNDQDFRFRPTIAITD